MDVDSLAAARRPVAEGEAGKGVGPLGAGFKPAPTVNGGGQAQGLPLRRDVMLRGGVEVPRPSPGQALLSKERRGGAQGRRCGVQGR